MNNNELHRKCKTSKNKAIKQILNYLEEKCGFNFSGYCSSIVDRQIRKRLMANKCIDFYEYLQYLKNNPNELDNLFNVLTINVSGFFRDTLTFEYIAKEILPFIISKKIKMLDNSIRIWSAACSTGEEPYSMAILINELLENEAHQFFPYIFATDIDEVALRRAQEGIYSFDSLKEIKYDLLKKYFIPEGGLLKLLPGIKKNSKFFSL